MRVLGSLVALALAGLAAAVVDPSHPAPTQFPRNVMSPRGSLLSLAPPDGAEFLVDQLFDVRIELHNVNSTVVPDITGYKLVINGDSPLNQFGLRADYALPKPENWTFAWTPDVAAVYAKKPVNVSVAAVAWRSVSLKVPGTYSVQLNVGNESISAVWTVRSFEGKKAKNAVLFIGDGMALSATTAARFISKQTKFGKFGKNFLSFAKMGTIGLVSPNGLDAIITDSANSASAYNTGHKSAVNALGVYPDTSANSLDDPKVETIAEYIRRKNPGRCIGVVTTAEIQDATPAAVWSHTRRRNDKAIITDQALFGVKNFSAAVKPDVLLGGGGEFFCNGTNLTCASNKNQNYYDIYKQAGYSVVNSKAELEAYSGSGPLLGIFSLNHMETWIERNMPAYFDGFNATKSDPFGHSYASQPQPNLDLMVKKAIEVMDARCGAKGWFLMAEAAAIDKMMHPIDFDRALADLLELERAVDVVLDYNAKNNGDTFIMLTSDHPQAYDVFGTVDTQFFNGQPLNLTGDDPLSVRKRRAIGEYQQSGWPDLVINDTTGLPTHWNGRFKLADGKVDAFAHTEDWQINQVDPKVNPSSRPYALVNTSYEVKGDSVASYNPKNDPEGIPFLPNDFPTDVNTVHSLSDVALFCGGPTEMLLKCSKPMDNTEIFFLLADALGLGSGAVVSKRDIDERYVATALEPELQYDVPVRRNAVQGHHPGEN
ncbi:alkaline phosphatase-like protein [Gonapodya prolifera JEL478]|uniref:alkaline phosphatase n=1 Tax=Gonapodya prolifera (strain JEL478) TaxID=1344416 RepID=A0A139A568_GONPJ|nr:alkaline phosphatase-like protein [Gonapodya prolifera JEL478]|eukprot:KXS11957.1 alkaline phosphatase-like protein [Gonapodya prolifera JEL478]